MPRRHTSGKGLQGRSRGTRDARRYQIHAACRFFSGSRIDQIGAAELAAWWEAEIISAGKDLGTGKGHLNALTGLWRHAAKTLEDLENPVPAFRTRVLSEHSGTASSRARDEGNKNPLKPAELAKLLPALEAYGNPDLLLTIVLTYECGLRIGEAIGLQWDDCWFGKDEKDTSRRIHVQRSRVGTRVGLTKSGRSRTVAMSRRLRHLLQARYMALGRPPGESWVISQSWPKNIRKRMTKVYKTAELSPFMLKSFRDTFATILILNGIVLKWTSLQLGHGSVAVTERHSARWMTQDGYRNPWQVPAGGLPTDLFAELDQWVPGRATTTPQDATKARR